MQAKSNRNRLHLIAISVIANANNASRILAMKARFGRPRAGHKQQEAKQGDGKTHFWLGPQLRGWCVTLHRFQAILCWLQTANKGGIDKTSKEQQKLNSLYLYTNNIKQFKNMPAFSDVIWNMICKCEVCEWMCTGTTWLMGWRECGKTRINDK